MMSEDDRRTTAPPEERRTMAGPPPEGWRLPKDASVVLPDEEYEKYIPIQEAINDFVSRQEKILCSHGPATKVDEITHPAHYTSGSIETIDFIQDKELNFALGNVIKYVVRADLKGNPIGDLKKARQYLDFEIEDRTRKSPEND